MSTGQLVTVSVVEIVALVAVLALFVILITRRLRSIVSALRQVSGGVVGAIQGDVCLIGAGAAILNRTLNTIAGALPTIAEKAESLPSPKTQARTSPPPPVQTSGPSWRPAVAQDPAVRRG